jgi:hypothetical protein
VGFFVVLNFEGSLTTEGGIDVTFVEADPLVGETNGSGTCEAVVSATDITFNIAGMDYEDYCYFEVEVVNAGPAVARVQSVEPDVSGFNSTLVGDGWDYCGVEIPADETPTLVGFQFQDFEAGVSYAFDSEYNEGMVFARADLYEPSNCN